MTTIATLEVPVADSWQITVGGGWFVLMLTGMALCFVAMLAFMSLMREGHGRPLCGPWRPRETMRPDTLKGTTRTPDPTVSSPESEARR